MTICKWRPALYAACQVLANTTANFPTHLHDPLSFFDKNLSLSLSTRTNTITTTLTNIFLKSSMPTCRRTRISKNKQIVATSSLSYHVTFSCQTVLNCAAYKVDCRISYNAPGDDKKPYSSGPETQHSKRTYLHAHSSGKTMRIQKQW